MSEQVPATDKPKQTQTRNRISPGMRAVIELMAFEGLPLRIAAQRANVKLDTAQRAIKKKPARALYKQLVSDIRNNAAQEAYLRMKHIAETEGNTRLGYDANRWVAGVDGISPVQKVEGNMRHNVVFGGFDYPDLEAKDVTPRDNQSPASDDDDE